MSVKVFKKILKIEVIAYLLAVDQAVPTGTEGSVYVITRGLEVWANIHGNCIVDFNAIRAEPVFLRYWEPRHVENLDEMRDAVLAEHLLVLDGRKRSNV
jgi:hypothetical protein